MKITCSKCGDFLEPNKIGTKNVYCRPCYNQYMVVNGKKYRYNDADTKDRNRVRALSRKAVKQGKIKREPCLVCKNPVTEFHHEDYGKPLQVVSLCRRHHSELHSGVLQINQGQT